MASSPSNSESWFFELFLNLSPISILFWFPRIFGLVDDRFLSVGSANTTNRSMGLDTELNASWEADSEKDSRFLHSMRRVRGNLFQEQTRASETDLPELGRREGLVDFLDRLAAREEYPFHILPLGEDESDLDWLEPLKEALPIDPEKALIEEDIFEMISNDKTGLFSTGISMLNQRLSDRGENPKSPPLHARGTSAGAVKSTRSFYPLAWLAFFSLLAGIAILWLLLRPH
jgi:phospholipase D1/2